MRFVCRTIMPFVGSALVIMTSWGCTRIGTALVDDDHLPDLVLDGGSVDAPPFGGGAGTEEEGGPGSDDAVDTPGADQPGEPVDTGDDDFIDDQPPTPDVNGAPNDSPDPDPPSQPVLGTYTIEPDEHADESELTYASAYLTLQTADDANQVVGLFTVTATVDGQGLAPTGELVFGHVSIQFFNDNRRLRMDFARQATNVQIMFGGGTFGQTEVGRLQAFDEFDRLVAEYTTDPRMDGETEMMMVSSTAGEIAWAVAYSDGDGSFGRLDNLSYTVIVAP